MKIEQIIEGKDSAALHVANAKYSTLFKDLVNIVTDAQASDRLHPVELLQELQALIAKQIKLNEGVSDSKHADCIERLFKLLKYHKKIAAEEGTAVNGIELAEDLEAFIAHEVEYAADKRKGL